LKEEAFLGGYLVTFVSLLKAQKSSYSPYVRKKYFRVSFFHSSANYRSKVYSDKSRFLLL
jgi:hypothetical protein